MNDVSPRTVIEEISRSIPSECKADIIIVGSLAAGYHFFHSNEVLHVRTKDIDCVISPHNRAVPAGTEIGHNLLGAGWQPMTEGGWGPGTKDTPLDELSAVRLYPPHSNEWFVELLTVPDSDEQMGKQWTRIVLQQGHYGIPSFRFLSLASFMPIPTEFGISYAQPLMMALANLLEHQEIQDATMSSLIGDREIKRSNKDLGRAVAIAHLTDASGERLDDWPPVCIYALKGCFPSSWKDLTQVVGNGLRQLIDSDDDLEQALHASNNGLLASEKVTEDDFRASAERLLVDVVEEVERTGVN